MSRERILTQSTPPEQLQIGDMILHKGEQAEVVEVKTWHDTWHETIYGVELLVKGKQIRTSFVASGRVELVA